MRLVRKLPGIEAVHDKRTAARLFDLPIDREGDVVVTRAPCPPAAPIAWARRGAVKLAQTA
jgi:hypothetical protein